MMTRPRFLATGLAFLLMASVSLAAEQERPASPPPHWDLAVRARRRRRIRRPSQRPGRQSLYYEGPPCRKADRVFAYYGVPKPAAGKLAADGPVHGGGGTAFDRWVRLWGDRGYAAIAMDLCGCVPSASTAIGSGTAWADHPAGAASTDRRAGPRINGPITPWPTSLGPFAAPFLSRSRSESDRRDGHLLGRLPDCIVSGVDPRFRFAVPVYGCGFLGDNSVWLPRVRKDGAGEGRAVAGLVGPLGAAAADEDPHALGHRHQRLRLPDGLAAESYRLPQGPRTLCLRVRMPHGHGPAGESPAEIHPFADVLLEHGVPMVKITGQGRQGEQAWATYAAPSPLERAELNFTRDPAPGRIANGRPRPPKSTPRSTA